MEENRTVAVLHEINKILQENWERIAHVAGCNQWELVELFERDGISQHAVTHDTNKREWYVVETTVMYDKCVEEEE